MRMLHEHLPALAPLLGFSHESSEVMHSSELFFSPAEPAINVYIEGGSFPPHEDKVCERSLSLGPWLSLCWLSGCCRLPACVPTRMFLCARLPACALASPPKRLRSTLPCACTQQRLTLLISLSDDHSFTGGGTAFWSANATRCALNSSAMDVPAFVLTPPAGTALMWGGNVTHAGQPVHSGRRTVFVASFSPRESPYIDPTL
jgi:hypothetical protein